MARRTFGLVALCFFFSGAAALLYEVVWLRLLGNAFGHTVHAISIVLAAYMGGLALGSLLLGRAADRVARPLRTYAILEALVGAWCLTTPLLFSWLDQAYLALFQRYAPGPVASGLIQLALSSLVLLPPTVLMGGTLPFLARAVVTSRGRVGSGAGALYAVNTWGAVAGTLATGFLLLPTIGLTATVLLGVGLNLLVAAGAALLDRRWAPAPSPDDEVAPDAGAVAGVTGPARGSGPAGPLAGGAAELPRAVVVAALVAIGASGAASMAYEVAWTRTLALVLSSSTYAFTAMLATFLVGLALGAGVVARLLRRRPFGAFAFGVVELAIGLVSLALLSAFGRLPGLVLGILGQLGLSQAATVATQFGVSFAVMILPTLLIGATFPLVVALLAGGLGRLGRDIGVVYGANTVGTIAGSLLAGFVLLPLVGIQRTVEVAAAINLAAGAAVLLARPAAPRRAVAAAAAGLLGYLALVALVPAWDRNLMTSGVSVYAPRYLKQGVARAGLEGVTEGRQLLFYEEGLNATVTVLQTPQARALSVNGKVDASNGVDMLTQLFLGHLPALLHPGARRALVIGLASGVTAGALARHPLERIDVAELEPAMLRAARFFDAENHGVLDDPRVRVITGDGRHVLAAAPEPYDLVISEPSNPWIAGVAGLFTRDFYLAARARLAPDGVMVQWLQGYSIFNREMRMVVRTFQEVFPYVSIWRAGGGDYLLLATPGPVVVDVAGIQRRVDASPGLKADLARSRLDAEGLLHQFALASDDVRAYAAGAPINTDDLPLLEFAAPLALYAAAVEENDQAIRAFRRQELPQVVNFDLARFRSPEGRLTTARALWARGLFYEAVEQARLAGPFAALPRPLQVEQARRFFLLARLEEALPALRALSAGGPDPQVERYLRSAEALVAAGLGTSLAERIRPWATSNPAESHDTFGSLLLRLGVERGEPQLFPVAVELYEAALQLEPDGWQIRNNLANAFYEMGDLPRAALAYQQVVTARPGEAEPRFNLGLVCEQLGLRDEALRSYQEAARLKPDWPPPRERLAALGAGRP